MGIQKQFEIAFNQLNYTVINLKHNPDKFQKLLESVPEFFIEHAWRLAALSFTMGQV